MKIRGMVTKTNYILTQVIFVSMNVITNLLYKLYPPAYIIGEIAYFLFLAAIFIAMIGIGICYGEDSKNRALKKNQQYMN